MQIRQSSLTQFGDSLVRFMLDVGSHDEDVKFSLDYLHSVYENRKCLTLISPDTGGHVLVRQESPIHPFNLLITCARIAPLPADPCWYVDIPKEKASIRTKQQLALWMWEVFKSLSFRDSSLEFTEKIDVLIKQGTESGLDFLQFGTYHVFDHYQYQI
jgi:hypothetical protein